MGGMPKWGAVDLVARSGRQRLSEEHQGKRSNHQYRRATHCR